MQYYYTLLNAVWHCKVHRLVYVTSIQHVISSIQEICESDLVAFNFGLIEINKKIYFFVSSNINSIADGTDHRSLYKKPLSRLSGCVEENMSVLLHCQMSTNKQKNYQIVCSDSQMDKNIWISKVGLQVVEGYRTKTNKMLTYFEQKRK